jgi:hypothetical protein
MRHPQGETPQNVVMRQSFFELLEAEEYWCFQLSGSECILGWDPLSHTTDRELLLKMKPALLSGAR